MQVKYLIDGNIYNLKSGYEFYLLHDINYFERPQSVPDDFGMLIYDDEISEFKRVPTSAIRLLNDIPKDIMINFMNHELSRRYKDWVDINDDFFIGRLERFQQNFKI